MHTHYTLEPASVLPKENGTYYTIEKWVDFPETFRDTCKFSEGEWKRVDKNLQIVHWLRPVTEEERAKEMGEFAEWTQLNDWIYSASESLWFYRSDGDPRTGKTTAELSALFTQEREKQKQQITTNK